MQPRTSLCRAHEIPEESWALLYKEGDGLSSKYVEPEVKRIGTKEDMDDKLKLEYLYELACLNMGSIYPITGDQFMVVDKDSSKTRFWFLHKGPIKE